MTKVAALYIATGRYTVFWPEFYESAEKYLLKDCEVHYFVFTDAATLPGDDNPRVHIFAQEAYSWPFATLRRFEIFLKQEQALKAFDYIFFFNANAEFMQPVTREMLLPRAEKGEHLLVVQHPSFYAKPNYEFTYDRNPRSTACIPYGLGKYYVCGGVNGGEAAASDVYADDFLYDMKKDPWQLNNVVADPAYAAVKAELRERLLNWIERAEGARPTITD